MRQSDDVLIYGYFYGTPEERRAKGYQYVDSERAMSTGHLSESGRDTYWTSEYGEFFLSREAVTHWMPLPEPP